MNIFTARFDLLTSQKVSDGIYKVTGNVIDNTGNYFATDVVISDIIYVDGSTVGAGILRYKIISVDSTTTGATLVANVQWDMTGTAVDLYDGATAIIGRKNKHLDTSAITSIFANMASEQLISSAKNYENELIDETIEQIDQELARTGDMHIADFDKDNDGTIDLTDHSKIADSVDWGNVKSKPTFATVATSGSYTDLTNKPVLSTVATSGSYTDLTNKPTIPTVSTAGVSGSYTDLTNKPILSTVAISGSYNDLLNKPSIPTVSTAGKTGDYNDLLNKPTIPTLPTLATVATSGSYDDLSNKPSIPTKTSQLQKDDVYTQTQVDTKISSLINDTTASLSTTYSASHIDGLLGGASSSSVMRYATGDAIVMATGAGVTVTKSGAIATITCPTGVKLITATIHFTAAEVGTTATCSIDYGSMANYDGAGLNSDYTNIIPPMYQVINDVSGSRAYKVAPSPAANLNTNSHTLQLTGLTASAAAWVRLVF